LKNARKGRSYARLGWLGTTLALAIALVIGSWNSYRGARAAVSTLNRGQADLLDTALRELTPPWDLELRPDSLAAFLQRHEAAGLRYVALLDPSGAVTMSAGETVAPLTAVRADSTSGVQRPLIEVGDRVRAFFPRRPMPSERGSGRRDGEPRFSDGPPAVDGGRGGPSRDDRGERGDRGSRGSGGQFGDRTSPNPHQTLLEFEPIVASELVSRAARSLALSAIGASILTLAALAFWRTSGQYELATIRHEEQKRLTVLGEMSAVLAHEIRNPLASLKGNAQLLAERAHDDPRMKARVDRVVS
jgi:two-component system sensor histidine kinase HydH